MHQNTMENIFNRKIIFLRKKRINFDNSLFLKIEEMILDDILDYFLIFGNLEKIKKILLLNSESRMINYINSNIFKNMEIINFDFPENDLDGIKQFNELPKKDLIVGINSFHNVNYLGKYLQSANNCLSGGGTFCGNLFGVGNLSELKKIIIKNDAEFSKNIYPRFNPTVSPESISMLLQQSGFRDIVISPEKINFEFNSKNALNDAMDFLKNTNERNYFSQMQKGVPSRKIFLDNISENIILDFDIIKFYCRK